MGLVRFTSAEDGRHVWVNAHHVRYMTEGSSQLPGHPEERLPNVTVLHLAGVILSVKGSPERIAEAIDSAMAP